MSLEIKNKKEKKKIFLFYRDTSDETLALVRKTLRDALDDPDPLVVDARSQILLSDVIMDDEVVHRDEYDREIQHILEDSLLTADFDTGPTRGEALRDYTGRNIRSSPPQEPHGDDDVGAMRRARKAVIDNYEDGVNLKEVWY